jgi:hypothetical protein
VKKYFFALLILAAHPLWAHEHRAPHGGNLVEIGEEFAHIELVLDAKSGKLTAYVLDGEAEKSVRIAQKILKLQINTTKGSPITLQLKAVTNPLTGDKTGDSSEFAVTSAKLRNLKKFTGWVEQATVFGKVFKKLEINFSCGNE